jgi:hypothetical protein
MGICEDGIEEWRACGKEATALAAVSIVEGPCHFAPVNFHSSSLICVELFPLVRRRRQMALPGSNRQREIILLPVQVRLVDFDLYHQSFIDGCVELVCPLL